tara:strand:- start:233 stop:505 length:273 start_codon:yes stop_codon:yes gene_type:complete
MKKLILLGMLFAASAGFAEDKPNIIVVMPDDIGYGDIASLGNPVMQTPNLDSLKRKSLALYYCSGSRHGQRDTGESGNKAPTLRDPEAFR